MLAAFTPARACYDFRMMDDDALAGLVERELPGVVVAYLFGSTAEGTAHAESDVDIAVLCGGPVPAELFWAAKERLEESLRRSVDLIDLHRAPTVLRMQVVTKGRVILVRDQAVRTRFEDLVFASYARLNEERKEIVAQVLRDGSIHGR